MLSPAQRLTMTGCCLTVVTRMSSRGLKAEGWRLTPRVGAAGKRRSVSSGSYQPVDSDGEEKQTHTGPSSADSSPSAPDGPTTDGTGLTGSAKLFADALHEDSSSSTACAAQLITNHTEGENWTGEERIQDMVLRMLVDKYKPLRGPVIRSAEEKIREVVPSPPANGNGMSASSSSSSKDWRNRAQEPLLPAIEGHKPWHTTFTPPSSSVARVKLGSFARASPKSARRVPVTGSEETVKQDLGAARRSANAERLSRARESTLEYQLGLSPLPPCPSSLSSPPSTPRRARSASLKAWSSLVEERIERARVEGQFRGLRGRGKPLRREEAEGNPFIAREEFLMNRIVQRNAAAPAWVELQGEVENAIRTFRTILRNTWTRRAIRLLTSSRSPSSLSSLTLSSVRALRDRAWVGREAGYHASALEEVNELVRRYNGVAPYAVRKAYFEREKELERMYWESGEDVLEGVRERVRRGAVGGVRGGEEDGEGGSGAGDTRSTSVWEMIRAWVAGWRN